MRGYSDAVPRLNAAQALHGRAIGKNVGNLIFTASTQRTLTTPDADVTVLKLASFWRHPERMSEEFDHVVIPLANSFRGEFTEALQQMTSFIEKVSIPVTILGVGAQASLSYDWSELDPLAGEVKAFVAAVLDHGPTIGVRGELTADYVRSLGFSDVTVIGCPSMFYNGTELKVGAGPERFDASTRIAFNLTRHVPLPDGWVREHFARHPASIYVAQDAVDLRMMLGGRPQTRPDADFPGNLAHPALRRNRTRLYLHGPTWIESMRSQEFAFGSRIHGNVAPLLAGVPAHVIAHDSRTRELAEYFEIPHTLSTQITSESTAEALFAASDYSGMIANHPRRLATFTDFLDSHGLDHIHRHPGVPSSFDEEVAAVGPRPESVISVRSTVPATLGEREWQSTAATQAQLLDLQQSVRELRREITRLQPTRTLRSRIRDRLRGR